MSAAGNGLEDAPSMEARARMHSVAKWQKHSVSRPLKEICKLLVEQGDADIMATGPRKESHDAAW